jgi:hypothetical protein
MMAQESTMVNLPPKEEIQQLMPPVLQVPLPAEEVLPPTPEHIRATEAVFAENSENQAVAGLLGMWTSTLLMHDLIHEATDESTEEKEEKLKKKRKPEDRSHP